MTENLADEKSEGRSGIQVIARAAAVLRALKETPSGQSLGQIAVAVNLPRSTVQRIVQALQEERLVISTSAGGSIRLGPELHALAGAARHSVTERCHPLLRQLMEATGETVDLSVLRGNRMIFLDQIPGTHRLRAISAVGEVFPLTTTANGRACLALMEDSAARKLAEDEWARLQAAADWPKLSAVLETARATGFALDINNHTDGISAMGFAFRDFSGELHAISVPIPTPRFEEQQEAVRAALSAIKVEITRIFKI